MRGRGSGVIPQNFHNRISSVIVGCRRKAGTADRGAAQFAKLHIQRIEKQQSAN